jgi:hypothetical protein
MINGVSTISPDPIIAKFQIPNPKSLLSPKCLTSTRLLETGLRAGRPNKSRSPNPNDQNDPKFKFQI